MMNYPAMLSLAHEEATSKRVRERWRSKNRRCRVCGDGLDSGKKIRRCGLCESVFYCSGEW